MVTIYCTFTQHGDKFTYRMVLELRSNMFDFVHAYINTEYVSAVQCLKKNLQVVNLPTCDVYAIHCVHSLGCSKSVFQVVKHTSDNLF